MGTLSLWHWLIVLVVIALVFGTGKIKNLGKDLGLAIKGCIHLCKGFKDGMTGDENIDDSELALGKNQKHAVK